MTTIKDIARLSGYSIGTVSRVMNHHPDVSAEARQKIQEVIARENYQPNTNAKLLKQQADTSITILVKGRQNMFFGDIVEKMQRILKDCNEDVSVVYLDDFANEVQSAIQICTERKPKGLIFLGGNVEYFKQHFGKIEIPAVLLTNDASDLGFENLSSYSVDDEKASKEAVSYLIKQGHRDIGIIGGSAHDINGEVQHVDYIRLQGCKQAFEESQIPFDEWKQYEPCRLSLKDAYIAAKNYLKRRPNTTAIFAISDTVAIGALRAVYDLGKKVPKDISILGYDGISYTGYSIPRLATVLQDTDVLARKGVEDILLRIHFHKKAIHEKIPFRVIAGESVTRLKGKKER